MSFDADQIYLNFPLYLSKHGPIEFEEWLKVAIHDGGSYTEAQIDALRRVHLKYAQVQPEGSSSKQAPAV